MSDKKVLAEFKSKCILALLTEFEIGFNRHVSTQEINILNEDPIHFALKVIRLAVDTSEEGSIDNYQPNSQEELIFDTQGPSYRKVDFESKEKQCANNERVVVKVSNEDVLMKESPKYHNDGVTSDQSRKIKSPTIEEMKQWYIDQRSKIKDVQNLGIERNNLEVVSENEEQILPVASIDKQINQRKRKSKTAFDALMNGKILKPNPSSPFK